MLKIVRLISVLVLLASCVPNKKIVYLQDINQSISLNKKIDYNYPAYQLKVGDILNIEVKTLDPVISEVFRTNSNTSAQLLQSASDVNYLTGFEINMNGDVELPLAGFVKVIDLTLEEAQQVLEDRLAAYIKDAYVIVRLGGIRYTAFGEFNQPGRYAILQKQVTIFEAVANAGDLSSIADRKKVKLIRQYADGQRLHEIDLTDRSIIQSPYYYIQPGDQVYAEPLKVRVFGNRVGVEGFNTIAGVLSIVSSTLLIIFTISQL